MSQRAEAKRAPIMERIVSLRLHDCDGQAPHIDLCALEDGFCLVREGGWSYTGKLNERPRTYSASGVLEEDIQGMFLDDLVRYLTPDRNRSGYVSLAYFKHWVEHDDTSVSFTVVVRSPFEEEDGLEHFFEFDLIGSRFRPAR